MRNLEKQSAKKTKQVNTQITTSQRNGENSSATNNSTPNSSLSFSWKQTLHSSIARVNLQLPKIPNKSQKPKLSKGLRQNTKLSKCLKVLNQDENIQLTEFLNQSVITYTNLGCKDYVNIGKFNCERK